ncbi:MULTISPECIES: ABC transporter permease DevC [unclassified Nostoc]|uniref:ABC transporter permease DevC n=1 Tax=unclassified Nostoc TaxID=2593658 RepID=UPI0025AAF545|nr:MULTISPECIES: ABC transporter permease DevC [unclassified Nostoc]MDM9582014.1 ABC transporter permease DevC [Nostoc sp. GT001]MDZ7949455.1 ABC transporter permease DevC [Nostoc sp. EfeVER01]MDZ7993755.1 ABC transporter permease DevC [Nostoc sp. EspVER01]
MTNRQHRKHWKGPPLAWQNLIQSKARLGAGVSAISFAVSLVFMQLGLFSGVMKGATLLYDSLNFDIVLISSKSPESTYVPPFSRRYLYQAGGTNGVAAARPLYLAFRSWRNVETKRIRALLLLGFNYRDPVLRVPEVYQSLPALQRQDTLLMNSLSRSEFGPREVGLKTELNRQEVEIVGLFSLNNTIRADGTAIVSDQNFIRLNPGRSLDDVSLGLITVEPGVKVDEVVQNLRQIMPATIKVFSRQEAMSRDREYWVKSTSLGYIIGVAVIMAFLVATVIVYQVLSSDVNERLHEYATLKAIGYTNLRLLSVVIQEALVLATLGFIPGCLLALGMYHAIFIATRLPVAMTVSRMLFVFVLTIVTCSASGFVVARKVLVADPADVF